MESSGSERVEMPTNFEDSPVEHLIQLIGDIPLLALEVNAWLTNSPLADMLLRLIVLNDRIPLSPYVSPNA